MQCSYHIAEPETALINEETADCPAYQITTKPGPCIHDPGLVVIWHHLKLMVSMFDPIPLASILLLCDTNYAVLCCIFCCYDQALNYLHFDSTWEFCIVDHSPPNGLFLSKFLITYTALPETRSYPPDVIHVYRGSMASITCPYVLGNLHEYLDPYEIFWDMCDDEAIQRISHTNATWLSPMNRVLRILVIEPVDTATYQCSLEVSRCTKFNENNEVMERCAVEGQSPFRGPVVSLNVLEPSRIAILPERMKVCTGEVANFTCAAYGSFISISWMFDGETFTCNKSSCEHNATTIQQDIVATGDNHTLSGNVSITSTLVIETTGDQFANIDAKESYTVYCILRQNPGDLVIQGEGNGVGMFSSALTIKQCADATFTPAETSPSMASEGLKTIIVVSGVVVAVMLMLSIIAAVMIVARSCSKRCKYPVESSTRLTVRERVYKELPKNIHVHGTESLYPWPPNNGVAYDLANHRGSDDHHSVVGSDVSGLSGVSGNEPGAHRMPTYSHTNSAVSLEQQLLIPPQSWEDAVTAEAELQHPSVQLHPLKEELLSSTKSLTALDKPCPLLLKKISLSSDNLPTLCLQRKTPSPLKAHRRLSKFTLPLKPVHGSSTEIDNRNTFTHLNSTSIEKLSQSDHEETFLAPTRREESSGCDTQSEANFLALMRQGELSSTAHQTKVFDAALLTQSHIRKTSSKVVENHRCSRSMSDITLILKPREVPVPIPQVGGAIKAGTPVYSNNRYYMDNEPCPLLLREISLSSDNLPTLCLNDCLLQLKIPSPLKRHQRLPKLKSSLKPVHDRESGAAIGNSTCSNSASIKNEAMKSSQSDYDLTPMKREENAQSEVKLPSNNASMRRQLHNQPYNHDQPHNQPPPICGSSKLPSHSSCSYESPPPPPSCYAGSRHSTSYSSQVSQPQVSDGVLLTVMNCLMHNKNCEILHCPCRQIQDRYKHLKASVVPLEQKTTPKRKFGSSIPRSSSSTDSSDSETTTARRGTMRLNLNRLHPHFHMTTRSHIRRITSREVKNYKSMSDLAPITETHTLQMGRANEDVRPCPLLLREISLSSDDYSVLLLSDSGTEITNDTGFRTESEMGEMEEIPQALCSTNPPNGQQSLCHQINAANSKQSCHQNGVALDLTNPKADSASDYHRSDGHRSVVPDSDVSELSGNEPANVYSQNIHVPHSSCADNVSARMCSPFETETTVEQDGTITRTTKC